MTIYKFIYLGLEDALCFMVVELSCCFFMSILQRVVNRNVLAMPLLLLISFIVTPFDAHAQGYADTGVSKATLENLCQMAALQGATGNTSSRHFVDTTLKGRFAIGNSTSQQYKNQLNWFRNNCPAY